MAIASPLLVIVPAAHQSRNRPISHLKLHGWARTGYNQTIFGQLEDDQPAKSWSATFTLRALRDIRTTAEYLHHLLEEALMLFLLLRTALVVLQSSGCRTRPGLLTHQIGIAALILSLCACWRRHVKLTGQTTAPLRQVAPGGAACAISSALPQGCHSWFRWRPWGRGLRCV